MKKKTTLREKLLFTIAVSSVVVIFISCGLNPFPFDGDPIQPPPHVLSIKDSLAVRAILDTNGLDSVKVRDVVGFWNSVVVRITLNSRSLNQFVFNTHFDSLWNGCELNLLYNNIDTLLFVDTIRNGIVINLEHNKLRTLPDDIDKMRAPLSMYANYNELSSISPNILHCDIYTLHIRNNHLVLVPDSIAALLSSQDSSWQSYQTP
jgi:hypothetical protein